MELDCPCKKKKCEYHGDCKACRVRHYSKDGLPYCERKQWRKKHAGAGIDYSINDRNDVNRG